MISFRDIRKIRYDRSIHAWRDKDHWAMNWHPGDPMEFRYVVIWHMCQSKNRVIYYLGQKWWGDP